jgi:hypothetical protein
VPARCWIATSEEFASLAGDREAVWNHPESDARLKKRIVRALIEEVIVDMDAEGGEIMAIVHWKGGVHTELRMPRRRRGHSRAHTPKEIVEARKSPNPDLLRRYHCRHSYAERAVHWNGEPLDAGTGGFAA